MFGDIRSNQITVAGLDIHYLSGGHGTPLVVIHGGSEGSRAWKKNMVELCQSYTVYVPDLPGFGLSQPIEGDYYVAELIMFVDDFARSLKLDTFHLMGHSLGGGIALSYALKFPHRIKKLVLVNSMFLGREIALWVRCLANPTVGRYVGKAVFSVLKGVKWLLKLLLAPIEFVMPFSITSIYLGTCIATIKQQTTVLVNRLSEVMVPTLIIWGAKDPILPVRQAYAAAQLIPDCQVKVFDDCGHSVYRDRISEFSSTLTGFLG